MGTVSMWPAISTRVGRPNCRAGQDRVAHAHAPRTARARAAPSRSSRRSVLRSRDTDGMSTSRRVRSAGSAYRSRSGIESELRSRPRTVPLPAVRKPWVWIAAPVVVVAAVVVGVVLVVNAVRSSSAAAAPECTVPAVSGAPVTVIVQGPQSSGAGAAGNAAAHASPTASHLGHRGAGRRPDAVQLQHASTINAVGLRRGLPQRARIIAVATALQESGLRNLPPAPATVDSVGLFQQRPSQGWGTRPSSSTPSTRPGLSTTPWLKVQGWQTHVTDQGAQNRAVSPRSRRVCEMGAEATTLVGVAPAAPPRWSAAVHRRGRSRPPRRRRPERPLPGTASAQPALAELLAAAQAELGGLRPCRW